MVVGVLVELSNKRIDKIFDYNVPLELISRVSIGIRVTVPFGRMTLEGFILEIKNNSDLEGGLKSIIDIVDEEVVLNHEMLQLGKIMQKITISTLISCYQCMLPKALKAKNGSSVNIKYDTFYRLGNIPNIKLNEKQNKIINKFKENDLILRKELIDISLSSLNTLVKKGMLIEEKREHFRLSYSDTTFEKKNLTDDQKSVVNDVINGNRDVYLIHGVTGSGKTEVYMEIIDFYLKQGKSSIVLVPEISLTPQMINRFRKRFGERIAALHSALSDGEKYDEWRRIIKGDASIVIGARSAIFAPLTNIGVIIIDEEHSESYKQSDPSPRYNAKDIALILT